MYVNTTGSITLSGCSFGTTSPSHSRKQHALARRKACALDACLFDPELIYLHFLLTLKWLKLQGSAPEVQSHLLKVEQAKGVQSMGKGTGLILQTSQETAAADTALVIKRVIKQVATLSRLT